MFRRLKDLIINRILGVADTPKRIAFGVFLGFFVAFTPTIGFQIVLYLAIAALLRANKVVGIPILFISNPVTAVPLYWFCWWVGAQILGTPEDGMNRDELRARVSEGQAATGDWTTAIWTVDFWKDSLSTLAAMGAELWLGSIVLGLASGVIGYFLALWGVRIYRRARGPRHSKA